MSRIVWLGMFGLLVIGVIVSRGTSAPSDVDSDRPVAQTDFQGQIVVIVVDQSSAIETRNRTEILRDPQIRMIGNRYFIVGKAVQRPGGEKDWRTGAEVGMAWDVVQQYYAYSPNDFETYLKGWAEDEDE